MIDVVFLLIIFFLVSSHLAKQESRMPLNLPAAGSKDVQDASENRVTIQIDEWGRVQVGSHSLQSGQLASWLLAHQRQHEGSASVRIRTDKTVVYSVVEPLLRDIASSGITDITFAVHEEQRQ